MKMYRQGDVLLVEKNIPTEAEIVETKGRIVLAEGEATGHFHAINDTTTASLFFTQQLNKMFLKVFSEAALTHEEHNAITLPEGEYEVIRQREYHPKEIRLVRD